jgi:hypothetical protein
MGSTNNMVLLAPKQEAEQIDVLCMILAAAERGGQG